jgi:hypothetical protein
MTGEEVPAYTVKLDAAAITPASDPIASGSTSTVTVPRQNVEALDLD